MWRNTPVILFLQMRVIRPLVRCTSNTIISIIFMLSISLDLYQNSLNSISLAMSPAKYFRTDYEVGGVEEVYAEHHSPTHNTITNFNNNNSMQFEKPFLR